ncbi:PaaI family thioesterase [Kallipyga massiliensis]|uniref:PaaI family thioesterase n=1 Tax=Kallipyga massiliensis TaxID=1472764 RepID=UPI0004B2DC60|nr:PaaI family thioesterase [Kallipyga massiliensis]
MALKDRKLNEEKKEEDRGPIEYHSPFRELLGIQVEKREEDFAILSCIVKEEFLNGGGIAHGGLVMALADTAMGTCFSNREDNRSYVTTDINYRFLGKAKAGDKLVATAHALREGGRILTSTCRLTVEGRLVGYASGSFYLLSD